MSATKPNILLPKEVKYILNVLTVMGYEAYIVGGCVRDSLLGLPPKDWDICTNALPEQVKQCFPTTIDTGLKHGTVTVVGEEGQYEVTTFRTDGVYSDHRRPDSVTFTGDLASDLARRDFTVNAMAYNPEVGLVDPEGGMVDLGKKSLTAVGDPHNRFSEDPLRIVRALRFAAVYGFSIEDYTATAIHESLNLLAHVSMERINAELCKLLAGQNVLKVLLEYKDIVAAIIPELKPCIGCAQNRFHQYDVYDHTAHAVANYTGDDVIVKMALLLHDIGKPEALTFDETGRHFPKHNIPGERIAADVIKRLRFSNEEQACIRELVMFHDMTLPATERAARRALNKLGERQLRRLLEVRRADIMAHTQQVIDLRIPELEAFIPIMEQQLAQQQCFTLKDLYISGHDLMRHGIKEGPIIGKILNQLLEEVMDESLENIYVALVSRALDLKREFGDDACS